jgi:hypothetical protein
MSSSKGMPCPSSQFLWGQWGAGASYIGEGMLSFCCQEEWQDLCGHGGIQNAVGTACSPQDRQRERDSWGREAVRV